MIAGGMAGFLLREQLLSLRVRRRREAILSEFPSVAELFALSVGAGESAAGALERIAGTARGELAGEFRTTLADMRAGASLSAALKAMGRRVQLAPVERFIGGVLIALDRGTPSPTSCARRPRTCVRWVAASSWRPPAGRRSR